jgi:hypothetical protein
MDIAGKSILILGGSGLVGRAVARRLLPHRPAKVTLMALTESEASEAAEALRPDAGDTVVDTAHGDVFVPASVARLSRNEMLADPALRRLVIEDLLAELDSGILERSFLYQLLLETRPDAVVDCINTATAFAYQDVFNTARDLLDAVDAGSVTSARVDQHVLSIPMPQLIRHVQILVEALRAAGTAAYVKIGTSGTGGMGFNVPYTHSEERPSRKLLGKSGVAGAHSLLLFLAGRTPGAPAMTEIKPTAVIAWREIAYGPIRRRGKPVVLYDCPEPLRVASAFGSKASGWKDTGRVLESVFADTGENGLFAREEFETVTAMGQMEFITPEEVADYVVMELQGRPSGRNIVAALDSATAGPTYRAGVLRRAAIERLRQAEREHGVRSIAFEMLGPPRLTKLLYEAYILSCLRGSYAELAEDEEQRLSREAVEFVRKDGGLRSTIISVGLPIALPGGKVYRAEEVMVPPATDDTDRAVARGWVDLREENCRVWIARARRVVEQARQRTAGTGSDAEWDALEPAHEISPAGFATWIFRYEDEGERIKR